MGHTAEQAPGKRDAHREQLRFIGDPTAPLLRRLRRLIVALALLVPAQTAAADGRVLVVPFDNRQHDPTVYWLSEASAGLLADELQARGVGAITRVERVRAFEQLHLPLSASLSRATLIKVGELVGASEVIVGSYTLERDTLKVNAHTIRIDVGRLQPDVVEQAPLNGLFPMFDALAGRLAPETRAPSGGRPARPPLGAFENYIKGLIAESPAAQATFLETAVRLFAGYDRAELALWEVRTEQ